MDVYSSSVGSRVSLALENRRQTLMGSSKKQVQRLIDFILVAEFDLTEGSTLALEYPNRTGLSHDKLAELMLPDGAHNRDEDWTFFFVNKELEQDIGDDDRMDKGDGESEFDTSNLILAYVYELKDSTSDSFGEWVQVDSDQKLVWLDKECVFVTNFNLRRIVSLFCGPELQLVTLEPNFVTVLSSQACVGFRFTLLNEASKFISHVEQLSRRDYVEDETLEVTEESDAEDEGEGKDLANTFVPLPQFMYCLNLVRTKKNSEWVRGAKVKSMAFCMQNQFIHAFKPLLILALEDIFARPDDKDYAKAVVANLYEAINSMDTSQMELLSEGHKIIRRSANDQTNNTFVSRVMYKSASSERPIMPIPVRIPLTMMPDEVGDQSYIIPLVQKFKENVMVIFNALLFEYNIVFLNYGRPANEVCNYVLAAVCMICPPMRGVTQRTFPYVNLVNMNFMSVTGFIAGTTNRLFKDREEWWDILVDIDSGEVRTTTKKQLIFKEHMSACADEDALVYTQVSDLIQHFASEETVKNAFQRYATHIVDMARDEEEFKTPAVRDKQYQAHANRIDEIRRTQAFGALNKYWEKKRRTSAIKNPLVLRHVRKLRVCEVLEDAEMLAIYTDFVDNVVTEEQMLEFLTLLPESDGGLFPIAIPVFHPSIHVRSMVVELLNRLATIQPGAILLSSLNDMVLNAYERNQYLLQ